MAEYIFLSLLIGSTVTLIGLAIVVLSLLFLKEKPANSIITGIAFVLFGIAILWLGLQGNATFHIKTNLTDEQIGLLLVVFVMSLFILRGVLDIRKGSMKLRDKTLSLYAVYLNRFRIIVGVIILIFAVFMVMLTISNVGK